MELASDYFSTDRCFKGETPMIIVWGSKLYGKVDEIEGVGYVATQFGHLFWIPLIPMNSYFVTRDGRHNFDGMPIGLYSKSVLVGYGRVFSVLLVLAGMGALGSLFDPHQVLEAEKVLSAKLTAAMGVLALPACIACYLPAVRFASYATATRLAHKLDLDERLRTCIEFYYGNLSEEEAEQRIDALNTDDGSEWHGDAELTEIYKRYVSA